MEYICHDKVRFNLSLITNSTNSSLLRNKEEVLYENGCEEILLIFSLGILYIVTLDIKTKQKIQTHSKPKTTDSLANCILTKALSLICLFLSVMISPIVATTLLLCLLYRKIVHQILKIQYGDKYVGLLEGTDAVWCIEDQSKCLINTLMIIETDSIKEFVNKIKNVMYKIVSDERYTKLKYNREIKYGYCYWKKVNFEVNNYISELKKVDDCKDGITKNVLLKLLGTYSNKPLPNNHKASWELLYGVQPLENTTNSKTKKYPIVIRFHHSVGDGIALVKMLLDFCDNNIIPQQNIPEKLSEKKLMKKIQIEFMSMFQMFLSFLFVPGHLAHMHLMRNQDNSILHGTRLSGEKVLAWVSEDEHFPVIRAVKKIKSQFSGMTFLDVVLNALSDGMYNHFKQYTEDVPDAVTTIIIETIEKIFPEEYLKYANGFKPCQLENRFSVGMINLPILPYSEAGTGSRTGTGKEFSKLQEVSRETRTLKTASPEYRINYWVLKVVAKLIPVPLLRPMLDIAHSTMAISNLVGPPEVTICDGCPIKDIAFWVPHRGLTGIGLSILSYGGRLEMGLIVDKALIPYTEDAQTLLDDAIKSIKRTKQKIQ